MGDSNEKIVASLDNVDLQKRETLLRLVRGSAYAIPIVASFAIDGLTVTSAMATPGNGS